MILDAIIEHTESGYSACLFDVHRMTLNTVLNEYVNLVRYERPVLLILNTLMLIPCLPFTTDSMSFLKAARFVVRSAIENRLSSGLGPNFRSFGSFERARIFFGVAAVICCELLAI